MLANFIASISLYKLLVTQHSFSTGTVTELVFSITKKNEEMVLNNEDCLVKDDQTDGVCLKGFKLKFSILLDKQPTLQDVHLYF